MLTGIELGKAIRRAVELKIATRAVRSQAAIAQHFEVKPPSLSDWMKKGSIAKDKLPELWRYFSDVAGPEHWGMSAADWPFDCAKPVASADVPAPSPPIPAAWPFKRIKQDEIAALDDDDLKHLEGAMAYVLGQLREGVMLVPSVTKRAAAGVGAGQAANDPAQAADAAAPEEAVDTDYIEVPQMDVKVAAGFGIENFEAPVRGGLMFRRSFLRGEGISPARARVVYVGGHSMEPELPHGAALLVDVCDLSLPDIRMDFVYALQIDGEECVKALTRDDDGRLVARSYNPEFEDIVLEGRTDFRVIGPAGWEGARIKPKGDEIRARHAAWRARRGK